MAATYITVRIHDHPSLFNLIDIQRDITGGRPYTHRMVGCDATEAILYYETDDARQFKENLASLFETDNFTFEMTVHKPGEMLPEPFLRGKSPKIA